MSLGQGRIELTVRIDASPETVFDFLVDPGKVVIWQGRAAYIESIPGGMYRVVLRDGVVMRGLFLEVNRPHKIVFSFGWEQSEVIPPGSTNVTYELEPDGGGTLVKFTHDGLPGDAVQRHTVGWSRYMNRLKLAGEGGDPGPDDE